MATGALKERLNGLIASEKPSQPHPLARLTGQEIDTARHVVVKALVSHLLLFRDIFAQEPTKAELVPFLKAEHSGELTEQTPRPPRLARVQYDTISKEGSRAYTESVVNVNTGEEVLRRIVANDFEPPLTMLVDTILYMNGSDHPSLVPSSKPFKMHAPNLQCGRRLLHSLNYPRALVSQPVHSQQIPIDRCSCLYRSMALRWTWS